MKKFFKKYKFYLLAFFIPFFLYILFFTWKGCFSNTNILNSDMAAQYQPLFQYLRNVLHGEASFPYSFSKGLGGGMYGTIFYYLANPLNLFVYFFEDIPFFLMLLVIFKLSLSGFTMFLFLKHKFKKENYTILLFSLAYAFMTYNINYYLNIMWLDGVILAPLVLIGIDNILEKKKDILYIVTLFLSIFFNYYIGYMITFFSVIYFGYQFYLTKDWKKDKKLILHFLFITLLVGLMTSFILIPSGLELLDTIRVVVPADKRIINWNFLDFVAPTNIAFGNLVNPLNYYGFPLFFGTVMVPLWICYFKNKKVERKEKKATIIVLFLFFLPILFPFLSRFWHMFTMPSAFNYRYGFLATLFSIVICLSSLEKLEVNKKILSTYYVIYLILMISLGYTSYLVPDYYIYISLPKLIVTAILVGINIFLLVKQKKKYICLLLSLELIVNLFWIGATSSFHSIDDYWNSKKQIEAFSSYCVENKRCETKNNYTLNDAFYGNYSGVSVFLTTMNGKVANMLTRLDDNSKDRNIYLYHPDLVLDTLLGVEMIESKHEITGYKIEKKYYYQNEPIYLLKNPYALPLGYAVSSQIKEVTINKNGIFMIEDILNAMSGKENHYFKKLEVVKLSSNQYQLIKKAKYPYIYILTDIPFTINGKEIEGYIYNYDSQVIYDEYGDELLLEFEEEVENLEVYILDLSKLEEFKNDVVDFNITENNKNEIVGEISLTEDRTLFTSIPYEKGWDVFVDNEKVDAIEVLNSFLAVDLKKGEHTIVLKYHIYGLKEGIILSLLSFLVLFGYEWRKKNTTQ